MAIPVALVAFLVDDSGSMRGMEESTRKAFNAYVDILKKTKGAEIKFSVSTFRDIIQSNVPIQDAVELTDENYKAACSHTPLWREITSLINTLDAELEKSGPRKVVVCVQTDGGDPGYHDSCAKLVKERMRQGWEFVWMATGSAMVGDGMGGPILQSVYGAKLLGIPQANVIRYGTSATKTLAAFEAAAWNIGSWASQRTNAIGFTEGQRKASQ